MSPNGTGLSVGAVVMAGGAGSRLGALGRLGPKGLLPLGEGYCLLTRVIRQLETAGVRQIVVCCSPQNHPVIQPVVDAFRTKTEYATDALVAVASADCPLGPVPALAETLGHVSGAWRLVCLADIYFATEPFSSFIHASTQANAMDGCLLTGTDLMARPDSGSGAVLCDGARVRAVSYRLPRVQEATAASSRRWSGSYFFRESLASELRVRPSAYYLAPFESWIQSSLEQGAVCSWSEAGEFVNVNSTRDYEYLMSLSSIPAG